MALNYGQPLGHLDRLFGFHNELLPKNEVGPKMSASEAALAPSLAVPLSLYIVVFYLVS